MRPHDPGCDGTNCRDEDGFLVHDSDCTSPEDMAATTAMEDGYSPRAAQIIRRAAYFRTRVHLRENSLPKQQNRRAS